MWILSESVMLSATPTMRSPAMIVGNDACAALKPTISAMLVTIPDAPPKLTFVSRKTSLWERRSEHWSF